jgi:hypothetical protein
MTPGESVDAADFSVNAVAFKSFMIRPNLFKTGGDEILAPFRQAHIRPHLRSAYHG